MKPQNGCTKAMLLIFMQMHPNNYLFVYTAHTPSLIKQIHFNVFSLRDIVLQSETIGVDLRFVTKWNYELGA